MKLVLLGDPVEHSRSPAIHAAALDASGIGGSYVARRVDRAGMVSAVAEIRYGALDGANVTMPHKETAFSLVDRVSEHGLRAGAINTIAHQSGMAAGDNTDIDGLRMVWAAAALNTEAPILILGSGGAAAAALVALAERRISIAARTPEAAEALLRRTRVDGGVVEWGTAIAGAVVVNATPIGMSGKSLPVGIIEAAVGLVDLPYAAAPTPAVVSAGEHGMPFADGRDVLVAQAAASFELWAGVAAPLQAMRAAAT